MAPEALWPLPSELGLSFPENREKSGVKMQWVNSWLLSIHKPYRGNVRGILQFCLFWILCESRANFKTYLPIFYALLTNHQGYQIRRLKWALNFRGKVLDKNLRPWILALAFTSCLYLIDLSQFLHTENEANSCFLPRVTMKSNEMMVK